MPPPLTVPIGLQLRQVTKAVSAAFDDALARAGGSLPVWLVLISVKSAQQGAEPDGAAQGRTGRGSATRRGGSGPAGQRRLAESVGIRDATLTHHLNAMEAAGLLTRRRDPANRRVHIVELTATGEALFSHLRDAAVAFDQRLCSELSEADLAALAGLLDRLRENVA
jgi:MarR family transcriptional regulator for hemolysin